MKKLILLSLLILILSSCSNDEDVSNTPDYMSEVFDVNSNCSENDFFNLSINNQNSNFDYSPNSDSILCHFYIGTVGGDCEDCEGSFATLPIPMENYNSLFPGLPIHIGSEWEFQNEQISVTEINMKGLMINVILPKNFIDNINIGKYYYIKNILKKGINLYFHWEVIGDNGYEIGYTLDLDENRPYEISINCIERTNDNKIRLTGSFSGIFVGKELFSFSESDDIIYEKPISGSFSYNIEL